MKLFINLSLKLCLFDFDIAEFDIDPSVEPDLVDFSVGLEVEFIMVDFDRAETSQLGVDSKHQALRNKGS